MTNDTAIKVEKLGKRYQIGEKQKSHNTLRDSIAAMFTGKFKKESKHERIDNQKFWALKGISFEVKRGEVVGIIGSNGAGKSTLLKTLARITEPTEGIIDIYGRVGSLLEVGTGFHPELTGRENVFLSGSILGMKKDEINRHFDEIVDFAEVEKFIDTPVKHYSSGMYLRLAFGVAAFLQPEILLVDEVLAVGDMVFQKKCLGKMDDVAKQGRTVLFVSHNMSAMQELCQRGILISKGEVAFDGAISDCINNYYQFNNLKTREKDSINSPLILSELKVNESLMPVVKSNESFEISLNVDAKNINNPKMFFILENILGQALVHVSIFSKELEQSKLDGHYNLKITLPPLWLSPGLYSIHSKFVVPSVNWSGKALSERITLEVRGKFDNTGKTILTPEVNWELENLSLKKASTIPTF